MAETHLPYATLAERIADLPLPPDTDGRVILVVMRPAVDVRVTPPRARLTPENGVEGDRWTHREKRTLDNQVTVMRADVARIIANGQPIELAGDNLFVELDLSSANLPSGSRLRVGTALCEVTPKPHNGCDKFAARFGQDARAITGAEQFRGWRLRGLHVRVVEPGEVSPGDPVRVLERAVPNQDLYGRASRSAAQESH